MLTTPFDFVSSDLHRRLLQDLFAGAMQDEEVTGMLLAGSWARGDAGPTSDLDVYFLLRDGCRRDFRAETRDGILVECGYSDFAKSLARLESNPMALYTYLDGCILLDREEGLARLTQIARERFNQFRVPTEERQGIAHWLRSALVKVAAAQAKGDSLKTAYVVTTTTYQIMVGLWAVNNRPLPSSGGVLPHLPGLEIRPDHLGDWPYLLFQAETTERVALFCRIAEWLIPRLEEGDALGK